MVCAHGGRIRRTVTLPAASRWWLPVTTPLPPSFAVISMR